MDLLAVQGTLKGLLQYHGSKASILWHPTFFIRSNSHIQFWRREWQATPEFLPGKSHGQRSLVGQRSPWDGKESDMTKQLTLSISHPYMTTGKTIALTTQTFVGKVMSLLFNTMSRFVIAFLPRSKHLLISWLQSLSAVILEPNKIVCYCFHCLPIYLP